LIKRITNQDQGFKHVFGRAYEKLIDFECKVLKNYPQRPEPPRFLKSWAQFYHQFLQEGNHGK